MGSNNYLLWVESVLGLIKEKRLLSKNEIFDFQIFDTPEKREIADWIKKSSFLSSEDQHKNKIMLAEGFPRIEDLFSTIDFKKFILQKRIGITESNSEYIENNGLSRMILVTNFLHQLQTEQTDISAFDDETRKNFKYVFEKIKKALN